MNGECIKTHQIAKDPILTWTVEMIKKYETFLVRQYLVMLKLNLLLKCSAVYHLNVRKLCKSGTEYIIW